MSVSQLFQLYAPLAGLLIMAFWVGGLSERVKNLRRDVDELLKSDSADGVQRDRLTRLEAVVENLTLNVEKVTRNQEGLQRTIGNMTERAFGFHVGEK